MQFAHEQGVSWNELPAAEQRRFDAHYNDGARRSARELARFGVRGEPIFERAQALIAQARN